VSTIVTTFGKVQQKPSAILIARDRKLQYGGGSITLVLKYHSATKKKSCLSQKGDLHSVVVEDIPNDPTLADFLDHIRIDRGNFGSTVSDFHCIISFICRDFNDKFRNLYHK